MKRVLGALIPVMLLAQVAASQQSNTLNSENTQYQNSSANAEGGTGIAWSDGGVSNASVDIGTTTISNFKTRTPPMTTYPPYLPLWNHGGWGTINAYFANGPAVQDGVYQREFDPSDTEDMRELRRVLTAIPYDGPINALGGVLRGVTAAFGGPDYYHRGRGFEIANSLVRDRRPRGKPLVVFIDSYIDPQLLQQAGYAYVGRLSLEGKYDRSWDQVYDAAIADTLPWDVDILLIAGGMKGVTVGSNVSFPSAAMGYSQANYSLSLFGGTAKGVTEGKGEAVVSASGFRYSPSLCQKQRVPEALFEKLRRSASAAAPADVTTARAAMPVTAPRVSSQACASPSKASVAPSKACATPSKPCPVAAQPCPAAPSAAAPGVTIRRGPGIEVSKQLYEMAGFTGQVDNVVVK